MSPVVTITKAAYGVLEGRSRDFFAGRVALTQALKNYLGENEKLDRKKIRIKNFENGQPYIERHDYLHCSLGHSWGWGIGAVAPYRIGVDIEKIRPHKKSLLAYIAEKEELHWVKNFFGARTDTITITWTIKESVMKALGVGFNISPKQVKIIRKEKSAFEVMTMFRGESSHWQVWPFKFRNFYFTVAYEKDHQQKPRIDWLGGAFVSPART